MIQRVQTLWMLLAMVVAFLTFQFPFYRGQLLSAADPDTGTLSAAGDIVVNVSDNFFILILTSALGTGLLINIFLFKHRKVQMRILIAAILVECFIIFLYVRLVNQFADGNLLLGSILHVFIFFFIFFAMRGIYKDSKLLKESNRLR